MAGAGGGGAEARCAQAAAGTSPTPGEGGASLRRRANEVPGNRGPPPPPQFCSSDRRPLGTWGNAAGKAWGTPVSPRAPLPAPTPRWRSSAHAPPGAVLRGLRASWWVG